MKQTVDIVNRIAITNLHTNVVHVGNGHSMGAKQAPAIGTVSVLVHPLVALRNVTISADGCRQLTNVQKVVGKERRGARRGELAAIVGNGNAAEWNTMRR